MLAMAALFAAIAPTPASATFPDGNGRIAFSAAVGDGVEIFTVRKDGRQLRQITHLGAFAQHVDWSPNGRWLVFEVGTETSARIAIARADGSHLRYVPQPDGVFEGQPSFTPDGRHIVFERYTIATNDDAIWIEKLDGTGAHRLIGSATNGFVTDPNVSPNGRRLSFAGWDGVTVGPGPVFEPAMGLFTARIDGSHVRQIRPSTTDQTVKGDWAPNGRRIGVTENANGYDPNDSANIVTFRRDGTGVRVLTDSHDPAVRYYLGSYSPNGDWIVFRVEDHGQFALKRMHPDGSHVQTILPFSSFKPFLIDWGPRADR
jgi:Tol biopolymer transport system component